jgi:hypothetical protein
MRRMSLMLVAAVALCGALAVPAQADHITQADADGSNCKIGGLILGWGPGVTLDAYSGHVVENRSVTILTCHFDVPKVFDTPEPSIPTWYLPKNGLRMTGSELACVRPGSANPDFSDDAFFNVSASGKGTLHCRFSNPSPYPQA